MLIHTKTAKKIPGMKNPKFKESSSRLATISTTTNPAQLMENRLGAVLDGEFLRYLGG